MRDEKSFQILPELDESARAALRASIERHGVLLPVIKDQHGRIIDGHHRTQLAEELGVECPVEVWEVADDDQGFELAGTLNLDRRHLSVDQRRRLTVDLRVAGHSLRAIGKALGVDDKTVRNDLGTADQSAVPERIIGLDGKSRPATRPARSIVPGDVVTDDYGDEREVEHVEEINGEIVLFDEEGEAIIVHPDHEVRVSKPDVGGGASHPARFALGLLPIFAAAVPVARYPRVLDPFAGTGRIHLLENGTVGVELEPEWARLHPDTLVGNALDLPFGDTSFDAIVTSPTYGNRFADKHDAKDGSLRRSYTHDLGRKLTESNSGGMQWGKDYRHFHAQAWEGAWRVLRSGGRFVLNVKDHDRQFTRQHVAAWHVTTLLGLGFELAWFDQLEGGGLRQGENHEDRYPEQIFVLDKP